MRIGISLHSVVRPKVSTLCRAECLDWDVRWNGLNGKISHRFAQGFAVEVRQFMTVSTKAESTVAPLTRGGYPDRYFSLICDRQFCFFFNSPVIGLAATF